MSLPFFNWSRTAASNATADSTVNWAEGQAPSSVNDSGRAMMASTAAFRDDISGAIATGGTSTAYTITSFQIFDTLAHMNGAMIAFTPHTTNGATVTLNVDGLGAKPLRSAPSVELLAGTIIQGTPYVATYNNSDAAWYLQNFYGNPYNVPLAAGMPYFATSAPNSSFVFPFGQAISRSTYSALFAILSTNFGVGDGSTTFNLPDLRGRVPAGYDAMGGAAASRLTGASGSGGLFTVSGGETETVVLGQLPTGITSVGTTGASTARFGGKSVPLFQNPAVTSLTAAGGVNGIYDTGGPGFVSSSPTGTVDATTAAVTSNNTGSQAAGGAVAHKNVQPTMQVNYIMRII